jgi:hypothetical protein
MTSGNPTVPDMPTEQLLLYFLSHTTGNYKIFIQRKPKSESDTMNVSKSLTRLSPVRF